MKICPHCGLVSEHHPLLKRLRQCIEEAFGHVPEFTSSKELTDMRGNPNSVLSQKILIKSRIIGQNDVHMIVHFLKEYTETADISLSEKLWHYAFQLVKIFSLLYQPIHQNDLYEFITLASRVLPETKDVSINLTSVIDGIGLLIDVIERKLEKSFYRRDETHKKPFDSVLVEDMLRDTLHLVSLVLFHLHQPPFSNSPLLGRRLIDLPTKEWARQLNRRNAHFPYDQFLDKLTQTTCASGSNEDAALEQHISPVVMLEFISQMCRLVCLSSRFINRRSLLHDACLSIFDDQNSYYNYGTPVNGLTVELLLCLGADPNCVDSDGETLVGYLLKKRRRENGKVHDLLAILMKAGAHLDAYKRSPDGKYKDENLRDFLMQYNICPVQNGRLTCLVATAMRHNGLTSGLVNFKDFLPTTLLKFIEKH